MSEENKINDRAQQPGEHTESQREQAELNSIVSAINRQAEKALDGTDAKPGKERRCKQCGGRIDPATGKCAACGAARPVLGAKQLLAALAGLVLVLGAAFFVMQNRTEEPPAEHVHAFDTHTVELAATCTAEGREKQLCVCGDFTETVLPATGHKTTQVSSKDATCSSKGEKISKCEYCGESFIAYTPALSHQYTAVVTQEPTCSANGTKTISCAGCGDSYTEPVAKIAHSYQAATCTSPKRCIGCGATTGAALGHIGTGVCGRCGITLVSGMVSGGDLQQYVSGGDLVPYN